MLILTHNNSVYPEIYRNQFREFVKLNYLGQFQESINKLTYCSSLTLNSSNVIYQKAMTYEDMNDNAMRDIHMEKLKKTRFKYLWKIWNKKSTANTRYK